MNYLDTSCLIKLLRDEPENASVRQAVDRESEVVVWSLVELETEAHLKAAAAGGEIRATQWRQYRAKLTAMRDFEPFNFRHLPSARFSTALRRHRDRQAIYGRAMDQLHLAAMEELKLRWLITLDEIQGKADAALGYQVIRPGRE